VAILELASGPLRGFAPSCLQLNAASGAITGTPTQTGSFPFTAQAVDTGRLTHSDARFDHYHWLRFLTHRRLPVGGGWPEERSWVYANFSAAGRPAAYSWSITGDATPGSDTLKQRTLSGVPYYTEHIRSRKATFDRLFASAAYTSSGSQLDKLPFVGAAQQFGGFHDPSLQRYKFSSVRRSRRGMVPGVIAMNLESGVFYVGFFPDRLCNANAKWLASWPNLLIDRWQVGNTSLPTAGHHNRRLKSLRR